MFKLEEIFSQNGEWFWAMCQFLVVSITLLLILRQLRLQNDSHLTTAFASFESRWNSRMMLQARRLVCERYAPNATNVEQALAQVAYFFEELGVYCKRRILDEEVLWEIYSFQIENYWVMGKNGISCFRKEFGDQTFFRNYESLYFRMREINVKKGAPADERTSQDLADFIFHELQIIEFIEFNQDTSFGTRDRVLADSVTTSEV